MNIKNEKIGFIGLGIMGEPMAKNLIKAGFDLIVYNRTKSKTASLKQLGAIVANTPSEVANNSKYIITMLTDSPDVEEVILGQDGVYQGIQNDSIVIDMSTISPNVTRDINSKLEYSLFELDEIKKESAEANKYAKSANTMTFSIMSELNKDDDKE